MKAVIKMNETRKSRRQSYLSEQYEVLMLQLLSAEPYTEEYEFLLEKINLIAEEVLDLYSSGCND